MKVGPVEAGDKLHHSSPSGIQVGEADRGALPANQIRDLVRVREDIKDDRRTTSLDAIGNRPAQIVMSVPHFGKDR